MAANPEPSETMGVDELKTLESSVLKALCLTINTAGSELKYKILDSLSDDDFYFPVFRAVFNTLAEMHLRGDYVISANLEEELSNKSVEMPADLTIDRLFDGTLPSLTELTGWVVRIKERSRTGMIPTVRPPHREAPKTPPPQAHATVVRSVDEVKRKIEEERRRSSPSVSKPGSSRSVSVPSSAPRSSPAVPPPRSSPSVAAPSPSPTLSPTPTTIPPRRAPSSPSIDPPSPAVASSPPKPAPSPGTPPPKRVQKAVLSSEGEDWASYLDELASKQGKSFETGFVPLDESLGGLRPGLLVLVDENQERLFSFLKQVTDQVASQGEVRCLYLASRLSKAQLRLRTLARLASVSAGDLEKGRLKKDSEEWGRVEAVGRGSGEWLRRVFVYEVQGELELGLALELVKKLLETGSEATCLVVVDALESVARRGGSASAVLSQLKDLADSLDVLVVAATVDPTLLSSRDADYAGVFRDSQGVVELEVLQAQRDTSAQVSFHYDAETCRFTVA